jgi:uncharacterized membrane protein
MASREASVKLTAVLGIYLSTGETQQAAPEWPGGLLGVSSFAVDTVSYLWLVRQSLWRSKCLAERNPTIGANRRPSPGPLTGPEAARTTAQLRAEHKHETSASQHTVDCLTAIVGLPAFAAALTISIALWVSANVAARMLGLWVVDPPPFVWLQGAITTGALYVAILILTTQRREEQLSSQREQLLLELAILNDQKSSKIIELLEESRRDNPMIADRIDGGARTMSTPSDHRAVMDAIKEL